MECAPKSEVSVRVSYSSLGPSLLSGIRRVVSFSRFGASLSWEIWLGTLDLGSSGLDCTVFAYAVPHCVIPRAYAIAQPSRGFATRSSVPLRGQYWWALGLCVVFLGSGNKWVPLLVLVVQSY